MRHLIFLILFLFAPILWAQAPCNCEPVDQQKDLVINTNVGKGVFDKAILSPLDGARVQIYKVVGIEPTACVCRSDSSWHKVRIIKYDIIRIYEKLGVPQLEQYYKLTASINIADLNKMNEPEEAGQKIKKYLDDIKKVIGIQ